MQTEKEVPKEISFNFLKDGNIAFYEVQLNIVDKKQNKNNSFVSLVSGLNLQKYLVIKKQEVQLEHLKVLIYKFGGLIFGKEKR